MNKHITIDKLLFLLTGLMLFAFAAKGQDVHYSQIGYSPMNLNPALTGAFTGDQRFAGNFRQQWASVPVPYLQLSGSYDIRFRNKKDYMSPWSGGLLFNYDRAGDAKLSLAQIGISGSYTTPLTPGSKNRLTFGAMVGGMQRAFQPGELQFDDQYEFKEGFSPLSPTAESFSNTSKFLGDVSIGANLHLQSDSTRTAVDFGVGIFHLTEPKKNFFDEVDADLQSRFSLYVLGAFEVAPKVDLLVSGALQVQSPHQEAILGLGGRYHVSQKKTEELALQAGLYYRPSDALIPSAGILYRAWQVNLSYDMTTTALRQANSRRGGPEVSVIYIFRKVPKIEYCKTCPTYM